MLVSVYCICAVLPNALAGKIIDNTNMNNILVTGAAGFIGAALVHRLLEKGENVFGIDNINFK